HRALIARVLEEGSQGAGQKLGAFQVQPWRLALDKSHHVTGRQTGEWRGPSAEPVREKSVNERGVIRNRGAGQRPRVAQVLHVRMHGTLGRCQSSGGDWFRGDDPFTTQKLQKVPEGSGITLAGPHLSPAMTQVTRGLVWLLVIESGSVSAPAVLRSHAAMAFSVSRRSGLQRWFRPLPSHRRWAPVPVTIAPQRRLTVSDARNPVCSATMRIAWSRR